MADLNLICPQITTASVTGSGFTLEEHENIDSLVHNLSEDTHTEVVRAAGKVVRVNTLTAPAGTNIRSVEVFRNSQGTVTGTVTIQYNADGLEIQRLVSTINRDGSGSVISVGTEEIT